MTALSISRSAVRNAAVPRFLTIAAELEYAITHGELATGEKLQPHRVLARSLGVTKATIGRAYHHLEKRGLVQAHVGDGTYVRALVPPATPVATASARARKVVDMAQNIAVDTRADILLLSTLTAMGAMPGGAADMLRYQPEPGMRPHREAGAQWLARFGTAGQWNRVMLTYGAQHALGIVLRTIARPGDVILTEALTYPGLIAWARALRLQLVGLACDSEGLLPEALDAAAQLYGANIVFCSPSLHNPSTATMSTERRDAIVRTVARRKLLLIEDTVHAALMKHPPEALSAWLPEHAFLICSFSKSVSPGLRVGYLECAPQWIDQLAATMRNDCWMVAPLMAELVTRWVRDGHIDQLAQCQRDHIAERLARVQHHLGNDDYRWHAEFPHVYLPLTDGVPAAQFAMDLRRAGVVVRTMGYFVAGRSAEPQALRLSLNTPHTLRELDRGLSIVARLRERSASHRQART